MKCYYEVLNVPRDADIADIKVAYKKLALKWHPDKNLSNEDVAKEQFQLIQQAYEVLSDRQERAWYDNHREQILHGTNSGYEDSSLDVYQYFTSTCFKGFGDDDTSFYSVYRHVFENIAKEDLEYMDDKEEFCSIPMFGNSQSDYDAIVKPFYDYWTSYSTRKSFAWLDPYSINEARDRRTLKYIDKENKKVRQKARKERNENVRALVAFVRKRDKRVQEHAKLLEAKKLKNKQKHEKLKIQKQRERKEQLNNTGLEAEWTKFDNVQSELQEIEKSLAEQFSDDLTDSDAESENVDETLYCVACNKIFKTPKTFKNHELSKKHKENVSVLKNSILNEEQNMSDSICEDNYISDEEISDLDNLGINSDIDIDQPVKKSKKKSKKSRKTIQIAQSEESGNSDVDGPSNMEAAEGVNETTVPEQIDVDFSEGKAKQKKMKKTKQFKNVEENGVSNNNLAENRGSKKVNKAKAKTLAEEAMQIDTNHNCVTCKANFVSKNKLFEHLKKTGHGVYLPQSVVKNKEKKRIVK